MRDSADILVGLAASKEGGAHMDDTFRKALGRTAERAVYGCPILPGHGYVSVPATRREVYRDALVNVLSVPRRTCAGSPRAGFTAGKGRPAEGEVGVSGHVLVLDLVLDRDGADCRDRAPGGGLRPKADSCQEIENRSRSRDARNHPSPVQGGDAGRGDDNRLAIECRANSSPERSGGKRQCEDAGS
jgi:hypothetical protein